MDHVGAGTLPSRPSESALAGRGVSSTRGGLAVGDFELPGEKEAPAMAGKTACEQLAAAVGAPDSEIIPAIFEALTDAKQAQLLLAAAPPATVAELAERTGLEAGEIEAMIDPLFKKGLLFKSRKPEAVRYYRPRHLVQLHDATGVAVYVKKMEEALPRPLLRVIPVNVSVEPSSQILAFDDIKELVDGARNLAVTRCSCRAIDGACEMPVDVCIQVDKAADYSIERGSGRQLTKQETLEMLKMCEEEGLVHVADNRRSLGLVICNCCGDCCINWTSLKYGSNKFAAPSRFRAAVDAEECNSCELCLDRCYFEAMSMDAESDLAVVDQENCMGCGLCQVICPTDAISMELARPEAFVPA
jgi:Pyruvate/2-oxoacid:ferredoxin oxidoreductase delta subunit/predicted transcriptional regulator